MLARIAFVLALILSTTAFAQTSTTVGVGAGSVAVDPSKNVLDALLAAVTRLNDLMERDRSRADDLRKEDKEFQNAMREAETRRTNDLGKQKQEFDLELARINKSSLDSSAILLATAVKELKTDSAERTGKLEQFANEQRGRTSGGNEVWALVGILVTMLLGAGAVITSLMRNKRNEHESEDAERYRRYVERVVAPVIPAATTQPGG
jgi:hypothetical protein